MKGGEGVVEKEEEKGDIYIYFKFFGFLGIVNGKFYHLVWVLYLYF